MSIIDKLTKFVNPRFMAEQKAAKVISAATQVFLRYGFRRATMGDIADAARMSRPALYLVFPSKEEILTAVMARLFTSALDEIRQGLGRFATAEEKLTFAFDVWCVRPFEMILASPDAKDLLQSSFEFATEVTTRAAVDFETILAEVLRPEGRGKTRADLSSAQIAHILANAVPGFKESAKTAAQLHELIAGLITIVLTSLHNPQERRKGPAG
jgi:AcrR family transcriptional regulator